jgi:hypothetical protein
MRFYEFKIAEKIFEQKQILAEGTRGIIGAVEDNQAGKSNKLQYIDGKKFEPVKFWMFPEDPNKKQYEDEIIKTPVPGVDNADPETPGNDKPLSADDQFQADLKQAGLNPNNILDCSPSPRQKKFAALVVEVETDNGPLFLMKYWGYKSNNYLKWLMGEFVTHVNAKGIPIEQVKGEGSEAIHPTVRLYPNRCGITTGQMPLNNVISILRSGAGGDAEKFPLDQREIVANFCENLGQPVECTKEYDRNYEVQAGEIVGPFALASNQIVVGNYLEAEQELLDMLEPGLKWSNMINVDYPAREVEELIDSYLISPKGIRVGISSKDGGGGAKASAVSIANTLEENRSRIEKMHPNFLKDPKNKEYFAYMDIIKQPGTKNQIYKLAAQVKLITTSQRDKLIALLEKGGVDLNNAQLIIDIVGDKFYATCMDPATYAPRDKTSTRYRVLYHFSAGLAKLTAAKMNADVESLDRFFRTILESSNMVQVKAKFKMQGEDKGNFTQFNVIYPPVFEGTIRFHPFKKTAATHEPAAFAFEIGKKR